MSFDLHRGETLGIAGESGCGKSVTAQSILRIVPRNGRIVNGEILLRTAAGVVDLAKLDWKGRQVRSIRGTEVSMVFQEPMTAFSLAYTIGNQIMEAIRLHQECDKRTARARAVDTCCGAPACRTPSRRSMPIPLPSAAACGSGR